MSFIQETLVYLAIALLPATPTWIFDWRAWSGRRRSWAPKPVYRVAFPTAVFVFHRYNYWPLLVGVFGMCWAAVWLGTWMEIYSSGEVERLIIIGPSVLGIVLLVWWPQWLTPKWHKNWIARGGGEGSDAPLWDPAPQTSTRKMTS